MNQKSGQILPFCLLLITILTAIVVSNFEIGFLNLRKIQEQKKMDGIALDYATQYARGLNALAGLNEGLSIAAYRGYLMTLVAAGLAACSEIPYSPCIVPWSILEPKLPDFYKKLNKLGQSLAHQQEQIIHWMVQVRCQVSISGGLDMRDFEFYPHFDCPYNGGFESLPFERPDKSSSIPLIFDIPSPLVFKKEFFSEGNRMIFIGSNEINSKFKNVHPGQFQNLPSKVWDLSEIKIEGEDFQKMEFKPRLTAISLEQKLWSETLRKKPFYDWPNLTDIEDEIAH